MHREDFLNSIDIPNWGFLEFPAQEFPKIRSVTLEGAEWGING